MTTSIPAGAVVVFDIDDTLYLERDYVRSGFAAVARHVERVWSTGGLDEVLWAGFLDGVRGDAFDRGLAEIGLSVSSEEVRELVAVYRGHEPEISLLPDAVRLIDRLGSRPTAVITDGPAASQRAKWASLGLEEQLGLPVFTDELGVGRGKPDPAGYQLIEETIGVEPARCWYLADNPKKDFVTPLARGWTSVRIRRPLSLHESEPTPDGVVEVASFDELVD